MSSMVETEQRKRKDSGTEGRNKTSKETVTDDPVFEALRTIGEPSDPEDQQLIHQRYIVFHIIKFMLYIPVCWYLSKLYTISKFTNALSDILRVIGNLCCLWVSNPLTISADTLLTNSNESAAIRIVFDYESPTWKHCVYHIGVVVSDIFTPLAKLTKAIQEIAVLSIIYWFIHWREFEAEAAYIHDSYETFFGSLRFGVTHLKNSARTALCESPLKAAVCIRGLFCGLTLILMELYSLYYIYGMV